jgi:excisionase family DNA binding protein
VSIREQTEARADDPLLTPAQCASELGCTDRFIRAEIAAGRLKAIKVSHKMIRVRRSWFDDYLTRREINGQKEKT